MSQVQCPYCLARSELSASKRALSINGNLFFGWLRDEDTSTQLLASRPHAYRRLEFRGWSNQKLLKLSPSRTVIMVGSRR
jgi:hypothetical protein